MDDVVGTCRYCNKPILRERKKNWIILKTPMRDYYGNRIESIIHKDCLEGYLIIIFRDIEAQINAYQNIFRMFMKEENGNRRSNKKI